MLLISYYSDLFLSSTIVCSNCLNYLFNVDWNTVLSFDVLPAVNIIVLWVGVVGSTFSPAKQTGQKAMTVGNTHFLSYAGECYS
jgi:hypothetical protein